MKFNKFSITKNILFLVSMFWVLACSNPQKEVYSCSEAHPTGKCETGKTCVNGVCQTPVVLCSAENVDGFCEGEQICVEGICQDKDNNDCSAEHPAGKCEEGKTCINGNCLEDNKLCSETNPTGKCISGKTCIDGNCENNTNLCSSQNKNGLCEEGKTCVDGFCKDNSELCSADNPNGVCSDEKICIDGSCQVKRCDENDRKNCYPGDDSQIGKGICQKGVQVCNAGIWGACKNAITPKEEVCDGIDNNCDGAIDDGVLNACGFCGENPVEISNNHIDDDCDGLVDENDDGVEDCDGRTHQPCYTGDPATSGKGLCHGGFRDCVNGAWGECIGQVLPATEICDDNQDNNCNGYTDEFCNPTECVKTSETEVCNNNKDDDCNGLIDDGCDNNPRECEDGAVEICGDGIDNDCKNGIDDACSCTDGESIDCFSADPALIRNRENVRCKTGVMNCIGGELWGECVGEVLPSIEVCDGIDNDCDGLTDEGLLNACGTCGESCYIIDAEGDDLDGGTFDGVGHTDDGVTLDTTRVENNFIWIANSGSNQVRKLNTTNGPNNGLTTGPFNVGTNPSRTAVTRDGGVWVANRNSNNVHKLNPDGTLVPGFPVQLVGGCGPRGMAIDKNGNGWVGCYGNDYIYKISPTGSIFSGYPVSTGSRTYGLAIDSNGFLWNSGRTSSQNFRLNTNKNPGDPGFVTLHARGGTPYGITIDHDNNVWYGSYASSSSANIIKMTWDPNARNGAGDVVAHSYSSGSGRGGRGLAVDSRGHIWCAYSGNNQVCEYQSDGTVVHCYTGISAPVGVGIDSDEDVWVVTYYSGAYEFKFDTENPNATIRTSIINHPLGSGLVYTYSDMTGYNLRNITAPSGTFTLKQDTEHEDATYDSVNIIGQNPNNSKIKVRARVSNDQSNWSAWSEFGFFVDNNSDIPLIWAGNKPAGRYIQVQIVLELGDNDSKPIFSEIHVNWQRP